jgi:hypothetical protein
MFPAICVFNHRCVPPSHVTTYLPATVSQVSHFYCGICAPLIAYLTNVAANVKHSPSFKAFALVHILSIVFGVRAGQNDGVLKNMSAISTPCFVSRFQQQTTNTQHLFMNLLPTARK